MECIICQEIMEESDVVSLSCAPGRHVYHRSCIQQWIICQGVDMPSCPMCRSPILYEEVEECFEDGIWDTNIAILEA